MTRNLVDLHDQDMCEAGKPPRRSKAAVMEALKEAPGPVKLPQLNRERLSEFGEKRANTTIDNSDDDFNRLLCPLSAPRRL